MIYGLDLFSGIAGNTIALRDYVKTIAYCEQDRHAQAVLLSRMADGHIDRAPICDDVTHLDGNELRGRVDIIVGGFPCQDISVAGLGVGISGKRSGLFSEIVRLAKEIEPKFLFLENVPAIRTRGLDTVIEQLTGLGYDLRWCMLSAAQVGAPHKRERWFLLANADDRKRVELRDLPRSDETKNRSEVQDENTADESRDGGEHARVLADAGSRRWDEPSEGKVELTRRAEAQRSGDVTDSERIELRHEQQWKPRRSADGICDQGKTEPRDDGEEKPMADSDQARLQVGIGERGDFDEKLAAVKRGGEDVADSECSGNRAESRSVGGEKEGGKSFKPLSPSGSSSSSSLPRFEGKLMPHGGWTTEPDVGRGINEFSERLDRAKSTRREMVQGWPENWEDVIPRVVSSDSYRVERIKRLGNAVVPLQAKTAFEYLMGIK